MEAITATSPTATAGTATTGLGSGAQDIEDTFLTLLVTQLQNQDPLNPMENAELTSQLAQISTVEGIENLNASLEAMLASYASSQVLQAAGLIGHEVLVDGSALQLAAGVAGGAAQLPQTADQVTVKIYDANGNVVQTLALGEQSAGIVEFVWDGSDSAGQTLADGKYSFTVTATADGEYVEATPLSLATVGSVAVQGGTVLLELPGMGEVGLDQVHQIY